LPYYFFHSSPFPFIFCLIWCYSKSKNLIPNKLGFIFTFTLLCISLQAEFYQHPKLVELRKECDSLQCPKRYAEAYRLLAEDLYLPLEERFAYLDIAEQISREIADQYDLMAIFAQRGRMYLDKGRFVESLAAFSDGMTYAGSREDPKWLEQEGWFLTGYGILLYRVALFEDARAVFKECAKVMHRIEDDYGEAVALNNVGLCFLNLGDLDSAEHHFKTAFEIRKRIGDQFLLCHSQLYLARLYRLKEQWAKADLAVQAAQRYSEEAKTFEFVGDIYAEWAEIALADEDLAEAAHFLNRAKEMSAPFRDLRWMQLKIRLFQKLNIADSLNFYLDSALYTAKEFGNLDLQLELLAQKEHLLNQIGEKKKADSILKVSLALSKELLSVKDSIQHDMMQVQRAFANNRQQLLILEKGNLEKEQIIAKQRRNLILTTIIALVLLSSFIIYYRVSQRIRKLSRNVRLLNERSRLAAEQMTAGVLALDKSGRLIFINQAAQEHFSFFNEKPLEEGADFLKQLRNEGLSKDWELRVNETRKHKTFQNISSRQKDLRTYYHLVSISLMESEGENEGLVAVITDVTSSQEKSIELGKKTHALEQSNKAKEKVLSLLAHDLKEGVVSSLELAKISLEENETQEMPKHLQMIKESLSRTKTLLFKTLDWVKHQGEGLQIQRNSFYLERLVNDVIKEVEPQLEAKKITCLNKIPKTLTVIADPNALRVVLRNLLTNAIKFTPSEQGKIEFSSKVLSEQQVELRIKDNGLGMSSQQVSNLMSGVALISTTGTKGEKGTGMGLSLCQQLLYQMGSTLKVESSKGEGSLFYFSLEGGPETSQQ
jgi:signal transduction histidine kinase